MTASSISRYPDRVKKGHGEPNTHHAAQVLLDEVRIVVHCFRNGAEDYAMIHQLLSERGVYAFGVKDRIHGHVGKALLLIYGHTQPVEGVYQLWVNLVQAGLLLPLLWC